MYLHSAAGLDGSVQATPTLQHLNTPSCLWAPRAAVRHRSSFAICVKPFSCAARGRSLLRAGVTDHAGRGECCSPGGGMPLLQGVQRLQRFLLFCQLITTARGDRKPCHQQCSSPERHMQQLLRLPNIPEAVMRTRPSARGRLRHPQGCAAAQPPQSGHSLWLQPYGLARNDLGGCRSTCALSHTLQQHGVLAAIRTVAVLPQKIESRSKLSISRCV